MSAQRSEFYLAMQFSIGISISPWEKKSCVSAHFTHPVPVVYLSVGSTTAESRSQPSFSSLMV
jgi:hypothetical protein